MAEKKTTSKKTSKKDVEELQDVNVPQDAEVQEEVKEETPAETPAEEPDGLNVPEQEEEPAAEPEQEPEPQPEPQSEPEPEPEPEPEEKNKNDESLDYEALNEEFKNTDEKIEHLLEGAKTPEEVQQVLETEIDRVKGLEEQIAADIKKAEGKVNKKVFRVDDFNDFWNGTSFT